MVSPKGSLLRNSGELSLTMNVKVGFPGDLNPAACVMLGSAHVGGDEEPLVLGEDLRSPLGVEGVGGIHKSVRDRTAAGEKERAGFVLAIARFDSGAG